MTKAEAMALMKKHGQICGECGGVTLDPHDACCDNCGADHWIEPEDFGNNFLGIGWADKQINKMLLNMEKEAKS
ncbi:MAG: hypothetical protein IH948_10060 [Bacteroidetes bacterium]|nr:hypothetical protein [Bacteroidota bacterium]